LINQAPQRPLLHSFIACFLLRCLPFAVNAIPRALESLESRDNFPRVTVQRPTLAFRTAGPTDVTAPSALNLRPRRCPLCPPHSRRSPFASGYYIARVVVQKSCFGLDPPSPSQQTVLTVSYLNLVDVPGCPTFPRYMPRLSRYPAPESVGTRREW